MKRLVPTLAALVLSLGTLTALRAQEAPPSLVDAARSAGNFETLLTALETAGLVDALSGPGPFTVLAPTDEAFARLGRSTLVELLRPESRGRLQDILKYHVIAGRVTGAQALRAAEAQPLRKGDRLAFTLQDGRLEVNGARVVRNDIEVANGIIHAIDAVLLPPQPVRTPSEECRALIALAIKRGAPLFNQGNPEACAAVYEIAVSSLLTVGPKQVLNEVRPLLSAALSDATGVSAREQAWTLRRALDRTWHALEPSDPTTPASDEEVSTVQNAVSLRSGSSVKPWSERRLEIREALRSADSRGADLETLISVAERAVDLLGPDSLLAARLARSLEQVEISRDRAALARQMRNLENSLTFEPVGEAELPEGWPAHTPIGEIQIKRYPDYRMAVASMGKRASGSSNGSFFRLFNHIKKNEIAMTAPVQMDYPEGGEASMAFLYRRPGQGEAGRDGSVEVVDVAPSLAVSLGIRGDLSPERVEEARAQLQGWLQARSDRYRATGGFRTMGWNSPFVARDQRYYEVQIPISTVSADG